MTPSLKSFISSNREKILRFVRFCITGTVAAAIHYGIYYLLLKTGVNVNVSYATGYIVSFVCNFYATNYFTFKTRPDWKKFIGFAGSHAINFLLHMLLLNLFLMLGMNELVAPVVVMAVAMLVQYTILNFVFRKR